jgi:ribA/ribD-fused uncharacterized protein
MSVDFLKDFQGDRNLLKENYHLGDRIENFPPHRDVFESFMSELEQDLGIAITGTMFGDPLTAIFMERFSKMEPIKIDEMLIEGVLGNFAKFKFELDGLDWKSSEQAYQASKFEITDFLQYTSIYLSTDPHEAYAMGQSRKHDIHPEFNEFRKESMYRCNMAKILQNENISKILASSTEKIIYPAGDKYWSVALPELMETIRNELKEGIVQITPHDSKKTRFIPFKIRLPKNNSNLFNINITGEYELEEEETDLYTFVNRCLCNSEDQGFLYKPFHLMILRNHANKFIKWFFGQKLKGKFSVDGFFVQVMFRGTVVSYSLSDLKNGF